jgi:hypothetical protein
MNVAPASRGRLAREVWPDPRSPPPGPQPRSGGIGPRTCWGSRALPTARDSPDTVTPWAASCFRCRDKTTRRTALYKLGDRLHHAVGGQILGPLGPLGGDDHPFFGEEVLAKLGQVNPSRFFYRRTKRFLQWPHSRTDEEPMRLSVLLRKGSSFRCLRSCRATSEPSLVLNNLWFIPAPERTRRMEESAFPRLL